MTPQPSEPRTAAGRALLSKRNRGRQMYVSAKRILAIEAEAAAPDPVATRAHAVFGQPGDDQRVVDEVTEARKAAVLLEGLRPFLLHRVTVAIVDGLAEYARLEGQPVAEEPGL